jgi:hypothetical protein
MAGRTKQGPATRKAAKSKAAKPAGYNALMVIETAKAVRSFGQFISPYVSATLKHAAGIVEDSLAYVRWERAQRYMLRAKEFAKKNDLPTPTRRLPLNVVVPLLQAATMEEDDDVQDMFARLLVNGSDQTRDVEAKRAYVSLLENFTSLEARIMRTLYGVPSEQRGKSSYSQELPDRYVPYERTDRQIFSDSSRPENWGLPTAHVQEALWNLRRLGCLSFDWIDMMEDNAAEARLVSMTPLGIALMRACS